MLDALAHVRPIYRLISLFPEQFPSLLHTIHPLSSSRNSSMRNGAKRIVLTALGSRGDVHPMLALAKSLQTCGLEPVILLAEPYRVLATAMGIESRSVIPTTEFEALLRRPEIWHHIKGVRLLLSEILMRYLPHLYETIVDLVDPQHGTVVSHPLDLASRIYREKNPGVTQIGFQLAPVAIRSWADPPRLGPHVIGTRWPPFAFHFNCWFADHLFVRSWMGNGLNQFRKSLGLPPVSRPLHQWSHAPDGNLCLFPDWYGPPDLPANFHCAGFPLFDGPPSPLAVDHTAETQTASGAFDSLENNERWVIFTAGSANRSAANFFSAATEACRQLSLPGILLTGSKQLIPQALPARVRHIEYAPLGDLLNHACLIVHHGGIGTTSQALATGTPQIICPMAYDQFDNAMRIRRLGCGLELPMKQVTPKKLTRTIQAILHSESQAGFRQRAEGLAQKLVGKHENLAMRRASEWILLQRRNKST